MLLEDCSLTQPEAGHSSGFSRRNFLKLTGIGLLICFAGPELEKLAAQDFTKLPFAKDFNAYLHIGPDGRVTCLVGKVEIGQGAQTAFAQLAADELDVPFDAVDVVMGDTDLCPWDLGTFAALGMSVYGPLVRGAAAEGRAVLLAMAAERWNVPVERLRVANGVISDMAQGKSIRYAELAQGQRIEKHITGVKPKAISALKIIGRPAPRKDGLEKVTGRAKYAADFALPGMVFARILRPPAHGAKLKGLDSSGLAAIPGAQLVRDGDLIAVLHPQPDMAERALRLLKADYEPSPNRLDDKTIYAHIATFEPLLKVAYEVGSVGEGEKQLLASVDAPAKAVLEGSYTNSYVAHATMETHTALAVWEDGKVTIRAATQVPFMARDAVAKALNVPKDKVRIICPYIGGGFGAKSSAGGMQDSIEAARIARAAGKPVQLMWQRPEEFFLDVFRPAALMRIRSGVTREGRIAFWDHTVFCAGERSPETFYDIPHQRVRAVGTWMPPDESNPPGLHPFRVGPWRAPSSSSNTFARESHMDVLAARLGVDPVEFRLQHLKKNDRTRRALETVARRFGWKPKPARGRGVGVACGEMYDTRIATMAEVAVDEATGTVKVLRLATVIDAGLIVNPEGARQQIEGQLIMGMGYALTEEMHFKNGQVLDRNFDSYEIPRFSWLPQMDVTLIDNPEVWARGLGEPPIITQGAVIANAICDATGARVTHMPMTPERVREALRANRKG